tara:strand:- start:595 stop:1494 length:900 start_codon:yes stop_codon:yes gene_type:complete
MKCDKITEKRNKFSESIDLLSIDQIVNIINHQDKQVAIEVGKSLKDIESFIFEVVLRLDDGGRLFYLGSGSSGRLGIIDAAECPPTFSTDSELIQGIIAGGNKALYRSIEKAEDSFIDGKKIINKYNINQQDILLGITASGSTPYVLGALKEAKSKGACTGILVCNKKPTLEYIDHIISIVVGPEIISGSTRMKAGTATKMVLNMITTTAMIKLNKTYGNLMVDLKATNSKLWDRGARIISSITKLDYKNSYELLKLVDGKVKVAIVKQIKNVSVDEAKKMLRINKGSLRGVIGDIKTK